MRRGCDASRGYTLIEMAAVISITAVVAAMTAVFLRLPLQSYEDAEQRAAIGGAASTAFTFLRRDLQNALANSIRLSTVSGVHYLEFLQTRTGGRYRGDPPSTSLASGATTCPDADGNGFANENVLQFGVPDGCFSTLGTVPQLDTVVPNADFVVVYNLGPGLAGADAYASGAATGGNKSLITSVSAGAGGENVIRFQPTTFELESPARRFQVISGPVSYVCDPVGGTLRRVHGYAITAAQQTPPAGMSVVLAQGLTGCTMTYDQNVASQRNGIVSMWLRFAETTGAAVHDVFRQVQVNNEP